MVHRRVIIDGVPRVLDEAEYTHALQRALLKLIFLAQYRGLGAESSVRQAKELIRCNVLNCGNAGACDGVGASDYPCPLGASDYSCPLRTS